MHDGSSTEMKNHDKQLNRTSNDNAKIHAVNVSFAGTMLMQ